MIEVNNVTKKFGKVHALINLSMNIEQGGIFGIVGSNGAGKSTLMRLITGVYKADGGEITIDGEKIYDNPEAKSKCVFLSDTAYFGIGATLDSMAIEYARYYSDFSVELYEELVEHFGLNPKIQLSNFSKGMQKQAMVILALACRCKYTFLDETLDGLDPVMRGVVKKQIYKSVIDRKSTVVITSHSLRELDDTCDNLAMLHDGRIIYQKDIQDIKTSLIKIQIAFDRDFDITEFTGVEILNYSKNGSVANLIVKGEKQKIHDVLLQKKPILLEMVSLSLEEIFTFELKERGYSFEDIIKEDSENE